MEIDKKQLKEVLEYTSYKIYCDIQNIQNEIKEENYEHKSTLQPHIWRVSYVREGWRQGQRVHY